MRVVCISDTHSKHDLIDVPDGDLLLHAGDWSGMGTMPELMRFNDWLGRQPHRYKVVICGNHEVGVYQYRSALSHLTNCIYLEDEEVTIEGIKVYGSPWTPRFGAWAFMQDRGVAIKRYWDQIPDDCQVLLTHGPAYGKLDEVWGYDILLRENVATHAGCEDLADAIQRVKPRLHVYGHIHGAAGRMYDSSTDTTYINAAQLGESYMPNGNVQVIDL